MYIYILRGLPSSGKTTWAKYLVQNSQNAPNQQLCYLNRKALHQLLYSCCTPANNLVIEQVWKDSLKACIRGGRNVILDECHLDSGSVDNIRRLANFWGREYKQRVAIRFMDFKVDLKTCLQWDKKRAEPMGEVRLKEMAEQFGWPLLAPPPTLWTKFLNLFKRAFK